MKKNKRQNKIDIQGIMEMMNIWKELNEANIKGMQRTYKELTENMNKYRELVVEYKKELTKHKDSMLEINDQWNIIIENTHRFMNTIFDAINFALNDNQRFNESISQLYTHISNLYSIILDLFLLIYINISKLNGLSKIMKKTKTIKEKDIEKLKEELIDKIFEKLYPDTDIGDMYV